MVLASANVVGGFVVTDRMLEMFKKREKKPELEPEVTNLLYLITIVAFILALRFLSNPATARRGNQIGALGMLVAIVVTFAQDSIVSYWEIVVGMVVGGAFGCVAARKVHMTAMPQMVALFNGVGGGAAALIALAEFHNRAPDPGTLKTDISIAIMLSAIIGSISFAGSMIAFAKLQELIGGTADRLPGQQAVNALLFAGVLAAGLAISAGAERQWLIWALVGGSLRSSASCSSCRSVAPTCRSSSRLLNAFTGLAAAATGFELENNVLIVSGMLVGASGTLLTVIMGRAMNRSIANVLFGAFGQIAPSAAGAAAARHGRPGALGERRRRRRDARLCGQGRLRAGLRDGGRPGAARRALAGQPAGGARRRGVVRDPPGGGADAGPHERAPRRGECPVPTAEGDGRGELGVPAHERGARDRRERRRQSGRAEQPRQPDLRHADPECRPGASRWSCSSAA